MNKLKVKFLGMKIAFWITFTFSRILNWLINLTGKYNNAVQPARSLADAVKRLEALKWTPDVIEIGGKEIKHSWMHTAKWVQTKLDAGEELQTDCDEFALYSIALLRGMWNISKPRLLTLRWVMPDGSHTGHNTCVFTYPDDTTGCLKFGTLCNWGLKKGFRTVDEAVMSFVSEHGGRLNAFTISTEELEILRYVKA